MGRLPTVDFRLRNCFHVHQKRIVSKLWLASRIREQRVTTTRSCTRRAVAGMLILELYIFSMGEPEKNGIVLGNGVRGTGLIVHQGHLPEKVPGDQDGQNCS